MKCEKTGYLFINSIKELKYDLNEIATPIGLFDYDYSDYYLIHSFEPIYKGKKYFSRYLIRKKNKLSEEQESFLLAENNLVSELFKEDKQIEVYSFDENTPESELRKFFYGDENKKEL